MVLISKYVLHRDMILLYLRDKGRVNKTKILEVVGASDSLSQSLRLLEEDGMIILEEKIIGRRNVFVDLTEKGHQVAEQLFNVELASKGNLKKSFFSRQQFIIMFLGSVGKATISQIKNEILGSYDDIKELEEMKLVKSDIDNTVHPSQNWIMLTENGMDVYGGIKKVEEKLKR